MWVGVFERDGAAVFVAFASSDVCLGFFEKPEDAWAALKKYLEGKKREIDEKLDAIVRLDRKTKWGRNGFGNWVFSDEVEGMIILQGFDEDGNPFYIVTDEEGNLLGEFSKLVEAIAFAREASRKLGLRR